MSLPEPEKSKKVDLACETREISINDDWDSLSVDHEDYTLFHHSMLVAGGYRQNAIVEFCAEKGFEHKDIVPYRSPVTIFGSLPKPLDCLVWRCPNSIWPQLFRYFCSIVMVRTTKDDKYYAHLIAQELPIKIGTEELSILFFGLATNSEVISMRPMDAIPAPPYFFDRSKPLPETLTEARRYFKTQGL